MSLFKSLAECRWLLHVPHVAAILVIGQMTTVARVAGHDSAWFMVAEVVAISLVTTAFVLAIREGRRLGEDRAEKKERARMESSYMVFDGVLKGGHHLVLRVAGEAEQKEFNGGTLVVGRGFQLLVKPVDAILHGVDERGREVQVNWHAQPMGKDDAVPEDKGGAN